MTAKLDAAGRVGLTADTITDEQIHELDRERAVDHDAVEDALSTRIHHMLRRAARARCAEILNARGAA
jgi:hypothetical protein